MPSASRPSETPDEVVQAFTGDTLEEAMAAAVTALGPDLVVRRARKVRAGLSGLMGRERYEVLALPDPSAPADPALALEDAFDALLGEADAREAEVAPYPVREAGASTRPSGPPAPPLSALSSPAARPLPPPPTPARRRPSTGVPAAAAGLVRDEMAPRLQETGVDERGTVQRAELEVRDRRDPREDEPPTRAGVRRSRSGPLSATAPHPGLDLLDHELATQEQAPARSRASRVLRRAAAPGPAPAAPVPAPLSAPEPAPEPAPPLRAVPDPLPEPLPPPAPEVLEPAPARRRREEPPPVPAYDEEEDVEVPEPEPAPRPKGRRAPVRRSGWSATNLQRLGVPPAVLEQLEPPRPSDDLAWVGALARAIAAVVPDPAEPSEAHPVVLSGHGLAGALAVLDAGTRGATPGTISYGGRTAPATATELALAVRHHLGGA